MEKIPIKNLDLFAKESNVIEGIHDHVRDRIHTEALDGLLFDGNITIPKLASFVSIIQPGAKLRLNPGDRVMIGGRECPPPSRIEGLLGNLLADVSEEKLSSYEAHCRYEMIHPFMDGNGRSGRALWLWIWANQEKRLVPNSFLHQFYYQTLQDFRKTRDSMLSGYWKEV